MVPQMSSAWSTLVEAAKEAAQVGRDGITPSCGICHQSVRRCDEATAREMPAIPCAGARLRIALSALPASGDESEAVTKANECTLEAFEISARIAEDYGQEGEDIVVERTGERVARRIRTFAEGARMGFGGKMKAAAGVLVSNDTDEWRGPIRDDAPLHTLWTKAKDQPGYVKAEWMALEAKLATRAIERTINKVERHVETGGEVLVIDSLPGAIVPSEPKKEPQDPDVWVVLSEHKAFGVEAGTPLTVNLDESLARYEKIGRCVRYVPASRVEKKA